MLSIARSLCIISFLHIRSHKIGEPTDSNESLYVAFNFIDRYKKIKLRWVYLYFPD